MSRGMLWTLAWRDVGRNRRRSLLSALAVALGLALLIVMNCLIAGITADSLSNAVRLDSGQVQLRRPSYSAEKLSLRGSELLTNLDAEVARASAQPHVSAASPVLWLGGVVTTPEESVNLRIVGLDPRSEVHASVRDALVTGSPLAAEDRGGVLISKRLADSLGLGVDRRINLAIVNADGQPVEATFTVRGLFATGIPTYDDATLLMPLDRAQALAGVRGRASAIVVLLDDEDKAEAVARALTTPDTAALTWQELNAFLIQGMQTAMSFYILLDAIVMLVVAVVIANTLLMAVFERVREMGILAALGMRGRLILEIFLLEAGILGVAGIAAGLVLGLLGVAYLATTGIYIGESIASSSGGVAMGTTMYARLVPTTVLALSLWTLAIILLAALYPARFAARLEPVEALRQARG